MWLTYAIGVTILHLFLLSVPFLSIPMAWTLTNLIHNTVLCDELLSWVRKVRGLAKMSHFKKKLQCNFIFLHVLKGAPWEVQDQGLARRLTHWEQIDYGVQFTRTRKFLTIVPIILFFLVSFYTRYDKAHFVPNFVSMMLVLIPKLPQFHCVRLFGINKY